VTGTSTGAPFDGRFTANLMALDGSLPDPGVCEFGHGKIRIDGTRGRYLVLIGGGDVCGEHVDGTNLVRYQFSGNYDVVSTSQRKLRGGDGWFEIRLTDNGQGTVSATDT